MARGTWWALVVVLAACCATAALGDTDMSTCTATADFPACVAPVATSQRVRKEVRSLSAQEWADVVAAMHIMKNVSMADGQAAYGSSFKTYDYFVTKHAVATTDTRGDQAHFGPQFMTWHGAFVLEFETALLAVDGSIEGMPYWDQSFTTPSAFDDTYFGSDPTSDTSFQVTTGAFADWPVESAFDIADFDTFISDDSTVAYEGPSTGFLRCSDASICSTGSSNANAFVTRYGTSSGAFAASTNFFGCTASTITSWNDWYDCIEHGNPSIHSSAHRTIGGSSGNSRGDFEDPVTSPNAPIFMFHHSNMERNKMHWMGNSSSIKCEYFSYPVSGATSSVGSGTEFGGINLNEEVASAWGFTAADLGITDPSAPSGQLTHADVLCWLNPAHAAYTFDSFNASAVDDDDDDEDDDDDLNAAAPRSVAQGLLLALGLLLHMGST